VRKQPGVTDTLTTIGGGQQQIVNNGTIYVRCTDVGEREKSQEEMMVSARELFKEFPARTQNRRSAGAGVLRRRFPQRQRAVFDFRSRLKKLEEVPRFARKDENDSRRG
jgi:multidrug efflux pump subunit AcrB